MRKLGSWLRAVFGRSQASVSGQNLGDRGEAAAAAFLRRLGYRIVATRHRNAHGEIDLIARDGATFVFVEVKTRATADAGQPFEAVDQHKQQRLTRAALVWLKLQRRMESPARFDIVSIIWPDSGGEPKIHHLRNAFEATGRGQMFS